MFKKTFLLSGFICLFLISFNLVNLQASQVSQLPNENTSTENTSSPTISVFDLVNSESQYTSTTREVLMNEIDSLENNQYDTLEEIEKITNNTVGLIITKSKEDSNVATYSFLIPMKDFESCSNDIVSLGNVVYDNTKQVNLSEKISSLQADIRNKKNYKSIIMKLLEDSKELDTILELEKYLVDVEIQQSTSENEFYSTVDLSNYGTLHLTINKFQKETPIDIEEEPDTKYSEKLSTTFKTSFSYTTNFLQQIIISISYMFVPIIIIIICIIVAKLIYKGGKKNDKK